MAGDSVREIQACIDALDRARSIEDPEARAIEARQVQQRLAELRGGEALPRSVGKGIEADDLDRTIAILELHKRSKRLRYLRVMPLVVVPLITLLAVYAMSSGGVNQDVVEISRDCGAVTDAIGEDLHQPLWSPGCGSTEDHGVAGGASWSLRVSGSGGSGRLNYQARKRDDKWHVLHATMNVDDRWIGVVPCTGEISEQDAKAVFDDDLSAEGTVREIEGAASVEKGDRCELEVLRVEHFPDESALNCQVRVRCNGQAIYGSHEHSGYAFCAVRDGRPEMARDYSGTTTDGDPMLVMYVSHKHVVVSDDGPTSYSFTVALD